MKILFLIIILYTPFLSVAQRVNIVVTDTQLTKPITTEVVTRSIELLNLVFNLPEFKDSLSKYAFVSTNRPNFSSEGNDIEGKAVYNDFINKGTVNINLKVKKLLNPWKRIISKTYGETNPGGYLILSYTWWLKRYKDKELVILYASHVGHEIFHTKYFGYVHDPKYNSGNFVNDRDVTYKIDDIIEALIRKTSN
jgi:hypothetical protein